MKKFLSLLLAILMVIPLFACGNPDDGGTPSGSTPSGSQSESESSGEDEMTFIESLVADRNKIDDGLPEYSANGTTITIDALHAENSNGYEADWIMAEEFTSDAMNNVLYQRMIDIETRFDVELNFIYMEDADYMGSRVTAVKAGLGDIDMIGVAPWGIELPLEGIFEDLNSLPHLDFDRPWWLTETNKTFELDGVSLIAFGSATGTSLFSGTAVTFFNRDLCENYGWEDLYQVVREERWTYDYLYDLVKKYYDDCDGIPDESEGDVYVFKGIEGQFWNLGGQFVRINEETGRPEFTLSSELHEDIFTKIKEMYNHHKIELDGIWFGEGRMFLYSTNLRMIEDCGDVEFEIGIIPPPKLNEHQEDYLVQGYFVGSSITIDSRNLETTALVLEALAYYGWRDCVPKYYETIIKYRYSSDPQNAEMLDLMYSNLRYDPVRMYSKITVDLVNAFIKYSSGFTAFSKKNEARHKKYVDLSIQKFEKLIERLYS